MSQNGSFVVVHYDSKCPPVKPQIVLKIYNILNIYIQLLLARPLLLL